MNRKTALGATYLGDGRCQFVVWAPLAREVDIHFTDPQERMVSLNGEARGYYEGAVEGTEPGSLYFYRLNGRDEYPDPASRFQPRGVHGPSQVVDPYFPWTDGDWSGIPLKDYIIYELHAGTFTSAGTFEAIIPYLDELTGLGITAVELMPVAQFPGNRNWGYDGVYPFAVQDSYGGPDGLKRLVDTCHQRGLAVVLDVVYNHLGPEGNYFGKFGHYFTERYHTLWGSALNFDGPHSDEVRRYFIENALYWLREFHIDALRLDALHAILDASPRTFLEELAASVHKQAERLHRRAYLIGESTANDARLLHPVELGGYGLDAQWNDEFHHSLHVLLSGERMGYYQDFGRMRHLVKAFQEGFVYSGEYSSYRQRRHGISSRDIPADRFVVFAQNHDQVGNRARSERLGQLISFEGLKLAAGVVLLSPFVPLLFMGEEYAEPAPFPYFISHSDPRLVEAVRKGRRAEFATFQWQGQPADPQDEATFLQAKLNHGLRNEGQHGVLLEFYRELIRLRKESPALANLSKDSLEVQGYERAKILFLRRWSKDEEVCLVFNFSNTQSSEAVPFPEGRWYRELDSADGRWGGQGSAVPEWLDSEGEVILTLSPWGFTVFKRVKGD
jgi:maltooligosyltrehalose trehalohydrolase